MAKKTRGQTAKARRVSQPSHLTRYAEFRSTGCLPGFRGAFIVCSATLLCLVPFLGKAFNIDDPLFIWAAKHISGNPLNPYGFPVNWYGWEMPMSEVMKNPPFACYYLALAGSILGWSEVALHLAMLITAIATILGTYLLAARLCNRPVEAALAALLTPVFLLSSTTVMCDTMMLALFVWATLIWIVGLDKNKHGYLVLSAVLIGACTLTKYYGGVLIGLLLVYSLVKKRKLGLWVLHFAITGAILAAYQMITKDLYGKGLLSDAASYAGAIRQYQGVNYLSKVLIGLSFTGGCVSCVLFFVDRLWSWKWIGGGAVAALLLAIGLSQGGVVERKMVTDVAGIPWNVAAQFGPMIVLGLGIMALAVSDYLKYRNAESALLALWVLGTYIFATFCNWTVNGRSILPMVPAVGILLMRRMDVIDPNMRKQPTWLMPASLAAAALLALLVTYSDSSLANLSREATKQIRERYASVAKTVWYEGHWGFQYYMDKLGFKAVNFQECDLALGDIVVLPRYNNTNLYPLPNEATKLRDILELGEGRRLTTTSMHVGAGFYSDLFGPLPYAFGAVPPEQYLIIDVITKITKIQFRVRNESKMKPNSGKPLK